MKKIIIVFIVMVVVVIGAFFVFKKLTPLEPKPPMETDGKCGDNICDEFEKANPNACKADCAILPSSSFPAKTDSECDINKDGKIDSFEKEICSQEPPAQTPTKSSSSSSTQTSESTAVVTIDASKPLGKFSPYLFGYVGSALTKKSVDLARSSGYKFALAYAQRGDGGNCNDTFITAADASIDILLNGGIAPMVLFDPLKKPTNLDTYSDCVKKTGKHLFDKGVKIFRFGSEPDSDGTFGDWDKKKGEQSNPIDVAQTYEAWAKALKSVDESIILEGPAISILSKENQVTDWVKKFLNYLDEHNAPLDIFTFHVYLKVPYAYYKQFNIAKQELQKHRISPLYGVPKTGSDEWLMKLGDLWSGDYSEEFDTTWAASAQINGLINMIEEGAVLSTPMFGINTEPDFLCHDFLPISCNGKAKPVFYAFQAFNQLAETNRLTTSVTDKMNFAAISGIKEAGGDKQIIIVLSNYNVAGYLDSYPDPILNDLMAHDSTAVGNIKNAQVYKNFELKINNTPWNSSQTISVKRYLIDDNNALVLSKENDQSITVANDGSVSLSAEISAPQVQIITLSPKDKSSLFSMEPVLSPDENYGKLDVKGKQTFEKTQNKTEN